MFLYPWFQPVHPLSLSSPFHPTEETQSNSSSFVNLLSAKVNRRHLKHSPKDHIPNHLCQVFDRESLIELLVKEKRFSETDCVPVTPQIVKLVISPLCWTLLNVMFDELLKHSS
eukprot:TRINITY_DN5313_c0_g1_i1.p1 TRINITY_DN5313_c0_g1~~TRINITY_DN5313_c0_g1_i1.p1  ORF type:complete len:114 (+),score=21.22 TRINITY_DN5313_c0_g1_i1:80-421(+)